MSYQQQEAGHQVATQRVEDLSAPPSYLEAVGAVSPSTTKRDDGPNVIINLPPGYEHEEYVEAPSGKESVLAWLMWHVMRVGFAHVC